MELKTCKPLSTKEFVVPSVENENRISCMSDPVRLRVARLATCD